MTAGRTEITPAGHLPGSADGITEVWADQLRPLPPGTPLTCPQCHGDRFTADWAPYGLTLVCWDCPTYIGVRDYGDLPRFLRRLRAATDAEMVTANQAAELLGTTPASAYNSLLVYERKGLVSRAGSVRQHDQPGRNPIVWRIRPERNGGNPGE